MKSCLIAAMTLVVLWATHSTARAGSVAYTFTGSDQFGTIDLGSGLFTQLGNSGQLLSGLGVSGGNLYGGLYLGGSLYQVNPATGALALVGSGSITYEDTGSTTSGLYAIGGPHTGGGALSLYSIDPGTGIATLVGPTGLVYDGAADDTIGLSTGSGTLYFTFGAVNSIATLYTLNTATGAATAVGSTGAGADQLGAIVFENSTLYAGSNSNGSGVREAVYTLNSGTGAGTFVTNASGMTGTFGGLAPFQASAVPEPVTFWPFLGGLAAIAGLAWRSRRSI
jgi:hypothetical protein